MPHKHYVDRNNDIEPLRIWLIHDEKPGHVTQLKGLADCLATLASCEIFWLPSPIKKAQYLINKDAIPKPDIIIGAGHHTHLGVLWFSLVHRAFSGILMKPSLPLMLFDAIICPDHDRIRHQDSVLATKGTINKIQPPESTADKKLNLFLIGGESRHFIWDNERVIAQIQAICLEQSNENWQVVISRRTPETFRRLLQRQQPVNLSWIDDPALDMNELLCQAKIAWISSDSMSFIFEALTAGAQVGLIDLDIRKIKNRLSMCLGGLEREQMVTTFDRWRIDKIYAKPQGLWEAQRAARWLMKRFKQTHASRANI